jgi:hypothetical protein
MSSTCLEPRVYLQEDGCMCSYGAVCCTWAVYTVMVRYAVHGLYIQLWCGMLYMGCIYSFGAVCCTWAVYTVMVRYVVHGLYIQLWCGMLYMHRYKQSSRQKSEDETSGSKHVEDIKIKN